MVMKPSIFWVIKTCCPLKVNWYSSETSADFQRTTWRYIPEDRTLRLLFVYKEITAFRAEDVLTKTRTIIVQQTELKLLASCSYFLSTSPNLRTEAVCSFETLAKLYWTTRRNNPEGRTVQSHGCENLKSSLYLFFSVT
jgi:hypothetical protein